MEARDEAGWTAGAEGAQEWDARKGGDLCQKEPEGKYHGLLEERAEQG